jgi:hypothetical protein
VTEKNRKTRRRSHLIGVDDLAALLLARLLGHQDEAFALARVHSLATVVEALAEAFTLAAIAAEAGDQCFLLLLALAGAGVLGAGRIRDKGDRNRGRNHRSSGVQFHEATLFADPGDRQHWIGASARKFNRRSSTRTRFAAAN